jgi:hypothetical protein
MKVIEFSEKIKPLIEKSISKYGTEPENNYYYFRNNEEFKTKHYVFDFENDGVILANHDTGDNSWIIFPSGFIGNKGKSNEMLVKFCSYCLEKSKIVGLELREELFVEFRNELKNTNSNLKIKDIEWEQQWPITKLNEFDENFEGSKYYELRKVKSSILKNNKISVVASSKCSKVELNNLVDMWEAGRKSDDDPISHEYRQLIETGFEGTEFADVFLADGKTTGIVSGWIAPNSNVFYLAIVLHNYTIKNFGEFMYIETLKKLKKLGFDECNLGGSDEKLLAFKKKFMPTKFYKTFYCTVVKR